MGRPNFRKSKWPVNFGKETSVSKYYVDTRRLRSRTRRILHGTRVLIPISIERSKESKELWSWLDMVLSFSGSLGQKPYTPPIHIIPKENRPSQLGVRSSLTDPEFWVLAAGRDWPALVRFLDVTTHHDV